MNQYILLMIYSLLSAPLIGMVSNLSKSCYYLLLASISQSWMVSVSTSLSLHTLAILRCTWRRARGWRAGWATS